MRILPFTKDQWTKPNKSWKPLQGDEGLCEISSTDRPNDGGWCNARLDNLSWVDDRDMRVLQCKLG